MHGFIPKTLMTVLILAIKNKAGKIGSSENNRTIALDSTLPKVFQLILLPSLQR